MYGHITIDDNRAAAESTYNGKIIMSDVLLEHY